MNFIIKIILIAMVFNHSIYAHDLSDVETTTFSSSAISPIKQNGAQTDLAVYHAKKKVPSLAVPVISTAIASIFLIAISLRNNPEFKAEYFKQYPNQTEQDLKNCVKISGIWGVAFLAFGGYKFYKRNQIIAKNKKYEKIQKLQYNQ